MVYYNDINTEDLINSPQFTECFNYSETFENMPTEEQLFEYGVYIEGNALMKNFTMSVNGNPCVVKWRMEVQPTTIGDYVLTPRGVAINIGLDSFIDDVSTGFGYIIDGYTRDDIAKNMISDYTGYDLDIENLIVNGIINIYGQSAYDYNLADIIHNYFERFPNINNPCIVKQKLLPEGQSYITEYNHSDFINNIVAYNNNGIITPGYTPLQSKISLDHLLETDNNFKNIINGGQIIRVCFYQIAPKTFRMYINAYTFDNASIVTTNETDNNQHYAGTIIHIKGGRWATSPFDYGDDYYHNEDLWESDVDYTGEVFYNYYRNDWFANNGLSHGALVGSGPIIDSIGNISSLNPVKPISNVHSKWYLPDVNDVYKPVGHKPTDPTVPDVDKQPLVRQGKPPVNIKPKPINDVVPIPAIDPDSEDTFDDNVSLPNCVNIYHPSVFDVSDFFDWLWDRDTWEDKKEMNSNPLEPIISLHTLPLPNQIPVDEEGTLQYWYTTDGSLYKPIVLGYLTAQNMSATPPTDIEVPIVTNRVVRFCFGKVDIPRSYLDYRDFDREIYIYLPYIGFRQLRCDDITPYLNPFISEYFAELYLDYFIDIGTGDFQAIISINKNWSDKKVLYMFNGNMAVQVPLSATDKTRLEQAKWNTLMSVGNTMLSFGGTVAAGALGLNPAVAIGAFVGGVHNAMNIANQLNTLKNQNVVSVNRSGALAGGFGAMSPKTPYIVINSPIAYDTNYEPYCGDSSYCTIRLGTLKGFAKCKFVHVDTLTSATLEERNAIEVALLEGIIF